VRLENNPVVVLHRWVFFGHSIDRVLLLTHALSKFNPPRIGSFGASKMAPKNSGNVSAEVQRLRDAVEVMLSVWYKPKDSTERVKAVRALASTWNADCTVQPKPKPKPAATQPQPPAEEPTS
jgi:hypothetical protein